MLFEEAHDRGRWTGVGIVKSYIQVRKNNLPTTVQSQNWAIFFTFAMCDFIFFTFFVFCVSKCYFCTMKVSATAPRLSLNMYCIKFILRLKLKLRTINVLILLGQILHFSILNPYGSWYWMLPSSDWNISHHYTQTIEPTKTFYSSAISYLLCHRCFCPAVFDKKFC